MLNRFNIKGALLAVWLAAVIAIVLAIYNIDKFTRVIQVSVATLDESQGSLLARSEGVIRWREVTRGQGIFDGDTLATGESGGAKIKFDKYRALILGEDSQVQITAIGFQRGSAFVIKLIRGSAVPQISDSCKDCPNLILRAGEESYTISAGKKIAVFKPQGSRQARAVQAKIMPSNADLKSVVSVIKPALSSVAAAPPPPPPEPVLAPVFLVPLPPAPPVPASAHTSTSVASDTGKSDIRGNTKEATPTEISEPGNYAVAEDEMAADPLEKLVLDKMPAPMPPAPVPAAPQLQGGKMGLTDIGNIAAEPLKISGAELNKFDANRVEPTIEAAAEQKGISSVKNRSETITKSDQGIQTLKAPSLAAKKPLEAKPVAQSAATPSRPKQVAPKVVVAKLPPAPPPPPPLPTVKVESAPPPRGVEYWTLRSLDNPQGGALELPVPTTALEKQDASVLLRPYFTLSGNGQQEDVFVENPNDTSIKLPLKAIKKVGVLEQSGGVKRYHFKVRAGVEASRGEKQRNKLQSSEEIKFSLVTLGEVGDGPINIGVSEFAPRSENPNSIWVPAKREVDLFQSGLVIQLMNGTDYGRFTNLVRGSNFISLDKRHPLGNEGFFVVREDQIVAQVSGSLLNKQLIMKISSLLNGDFVFKGPKAAFQNIREFGQNRPGDPMWSLLNKGHVLYILKKGTLYPVNREFLKSSAEVAAFIGNQAQAIFVGKVEIVSTK